MYRGVGRRAETIIVAVVVAAVATGGPAVAGDIVAFAKQAGNSKTVNGLGASKTPRAGMLLPLNAKGLFPARVVPAGRPAPPAPWAPSAPLDRPGRQGRRDLPGRRASAASPA